ncbi:MAG: hypothetical protein F6K41_16650 [Symploca sp. SIO3E6]|nr:hypothetical protein [Caldora sp. SIO3E6]
MDNLSILTASCLLPFLSSSGEEIFVGFQFSPSPRPRVPASPRLLIICSPIFIFPVPVEL